MEHFFKALSDLRAFYPDTNDAEVLAAADIDHDIACIPKGFKNHDFKSEFTAYLTGSDTGDGKPSALDTLPPIGLLKIPPLRRFQWAIRDNKLLTLTWDNGRSARGPGVITATGDAKAHRTLDVDPKWVRSINKKIVA